MPTSKELVANKPLAGPDLAKIIQSDVAQLLQRDGMFSPHVAYGRVSYEVRVTMHMDNPSYPTHVTTMRSEKRSDNQVAAEPELAAIEPDLPLKEPSLEEYVASVERQRRIDSPNLARIEHQLPVTVQVAGEGGSSQEKQVVYPKEAVEGVAPAPTDIDLTRNTRAAWVANERP